MLVPVRGVGILAVVATDAVCVVGRGMLGNERTVLSVNPDRAGDNISILNSNFSGED